MRFRHWQANAYQLQRYCRPIVSDNDASASPLEKTAAAGQSVSISAKGTDVMSASWNRRAEVCGHLFALSEVRYQLFIGSSLQFSVDNPESRLKVSVLWLAGCLEFSVLAFQGQRQQIGRSKRSVDNPANLWIIWPFLWIGAAWFGFSWRLGGLDSFFRPSFAEVVTPARWVAARVEGARCPGRCLGH
jgi:hypothetical protein